MVLQFNIEGTVRNEIVDGSPEGFGSPKLPRILRPAKSDATFAELKLTVS